MAQELDINRLPYTLYTDEGRAALDHLDRARIHTDTGRRVFNITKCRGHILAAQHLLAHDYKKYESICTEFHIIQFFDT